MTALQKLLARVEAGKSFLLNPCHKTEQLGGGKAYLCRQAYNGSLDAAKALHEAVIDDYNFLMGVDWAEVWLPFGSKLHKFNVANTNPARAWLIAIIKALIAQEDAK
tara:strand:- start:42 stop:362 length:321 start_codon:yes stop_codon:yes gene_type:complete